MPEEIPTRIAPVCAKAVRVPSSLTAKKPSPGSSDRSVPVLSYQRTRSSPDPTPTSQPPW